MSGAFRLAQSPKEQKDSPRILFLALISKSDTPSAILSFESAESKPFIAAA